MGDRLATVVGDAVHLRRHGNLRWWPVHDRNSRAWSNASLAAASGFFDSIAIPDPKFMPGNGCIVGAIGLACGAWLRFLHRTRLRRMARNARESQHSTARRVQRRTISAGYELIHAAHSPEYRGGRLPTLMVLRPFREIRNAGTPGSRLRSASASSS